jgi:hypothetical protein
MQAQLRPIADSGRVTLLVAGTSCEELHSGTAVCYSRERVDGIALRSAFRVESFERAGRKAADGANKSTSATGSHSGLSPEGFSGYRFNLHKVLFEMILSLSGLHVKKRARGEGHTVRFPAAGNGRRPRMEVRESGSTGK